jgi:hypothetical protein
VRPDSDERDGPYVRRVLLPLRPIDLQQAIAGGPGGAGGQGDKKQGDNESQDGKGGSKQASQQRSCVTVGECIARYPGLVPNDPQIQSVVNGSLAACASDFAGVYPVPADCL